MTAAWELINYLTPEGRDPFSEWLAALADRDARAQVLPLVGGDKRGQRADIAAAVRYWHDWQEGNPK